MAGFLTSESRIFASDSAEAGVSTLAFLVAFALLFCIPNYVAWSLRLIKRKEPGSGRTLLCLIGTFVTALIFVVAPMVSRGGLEGNRLQIDFNDPYIVPICALPLIWALAVIWDQAQELLHAD